MFREVYNWWIGLSFSDKLAIIGLFLTILGFLYTGYQANAARKEAQRAKEQLFKTISIAELSQISNKLEEMARLTLRLKWMEIPDRCSNICSSLALLSQHPDLSDSKDRIEEIMSQIRIIESKSASANLKGVNPVKYSEISQNILTFRDELRVMTARISYEGNENK